jgi:uncharacterized protein (TIGR04562 family)
LREYILEENEKIPEHLADPSLLGDISNLILIASDKKDLENRGWACAILKVMHAFAHIQNDLFSQYSEQIQEQILKNFKTNVQEDAVTGIRLGRGGSAIYLHKFEVKPFKRSSSSVIKLLSKRQAVAISLLDRLGVRFVTRNLVDVFRVIDFLFRENVVSLPNVMPEQSNNSLYPVNLFFEVLSENQNETDHSKLHELLLKKLNNNQSRAQYNIKENEFSADEFKFIKFVCRYLVKLELGGKEVRFFFPFEIQIMDYETYIKNLSGPQAHDEYKKRQKLATRLRVLGKK